MRVWYRKDARTIMDYRGTVFGNRILFRIKIHQIFLLLLTWEDGNISLRTFAYYCILRHSFSISFHSMWWRIILVSFQITKFQKVTILCFSYIFILHFYIFKSFQHRKRLFSSPFDFRCKTDFFLILYMWHMPSSVSYLQFDICRFLESASGCSRL